MEKIAWSDELRVGVAILDRQHQRLMAVINKLIDRCSDTTGSETVSEVLDEMTRYAREHFATEEKLLEEHGYPQLEEQREQHRGFKRKTAALCSATMLDAPEVPEVLVTYIRGWLVDHILKEDMKYKPFFSEGTRVGSTKERPQAAGGAPVSASMGRDVRRETEATR